MIIIYDHHVWSSYLITIYDDHIWSSYMMIIYDHHICIDFSRSVIFNLVQRVLREKICFFTKKSDVKSDKNGKKHQNQNVCMSLSYVMTIYDHHIWSSYMMIIYDDHIWWSYMMIVYDDHIWWSYMKAHKKIMIWR